MVLFGACVSRDQHTANTSMLDIIRFGETILMVLFVKESQCLFSSG
jgi:hypothetical protein